MSSSRLKHHTVVPMRRYINYLLDEEYILDSKAQVNGRITCWQLGTLNLLDAVKMQGLKNSNPHTLYMYVQTLALAAHEITNIERF
jgi:hypothetical protein